MMTRGDGREASGRAGGMPICNTKIPAGGLRPAALVTGTHEARQKLTSNRMAGHIYLIGTSGPGPTSLKFTGRRAVNSHRFILLSMLLSGVSQPDATPPKEGESTGRGRE